MSLVTPDQAGIYTGDLEPAFEGTLSGADPVDATGVPTRLIGKQGGVIIFDELITDKTVDGDTTIVRYEWTTPFTVPGPIEWQVEVTWPGPRRQTFPACDPFYVWRDADLA